MDSNAQFREAAGQAVRRMVRVCGDVVSWDVISRGFMYQGETTYLASKAEGIFKPKQLLDGAALSIRTSKPSRAGRFASYRDEAVGDGLFHYKLQGSDPVNRRNQLLWNAKERRLPLIYFMGIADSLYIVMYPVYIEAIDKGKMEALLSASIDGEIETSIKERVLFTEEPLVRRYRTIEAHQRVHQVEFRQRVLAAYGNMCAVSHLPVVRLLDAAHILSDRHPLGEPEVSNGICLSKIHHRAYDANIMGIDPDGVIHIHRDLLQITDGPLLEQGLKAMDGKVIRYPKKSSLRPNRDFLAERFDEFRAAL